MNRVLVISHLPFSRETNVGKTLINLFDGYPKDALSQLYFTESGARMEGIRYYRVTDSDVLGTLRNGHKQCGGEMDTSQKPKQTVPVRPSNKRKPSLLLLRDLLWRIGSWHTEELKKWLREIAPDVIFLAPGYSVFAYEVAQRISLELRIPLYIYFMEDFYNERVFTFSPFFWLRYVVFRSSIRKCVDYANEIIVLNEALRIKYEKDFHKHVIVIYNPATCVQDKKLYTLGARRGLRFLYGGSIGFDRIDTLIDIAKGLSGANKRFADVDIRASFIVFGHAKCDEIIQKLDSLEVVTYGGTLAEEELEKEIHEADVLVHVESFKPKYVAKTRRALSTKIPEYLASGKLILAVGPREIESIQYLERNCAAITVTELDKLDDTISCILSNDLNANAYRCNAKALALRNHDKRRNQEKLYRLLAGDGIARS